MKAALALCLLLAGLQALAQASPPPAATTATTEAPDRAARRSAVIRYGIESEITELLKALAQEKDGTHDAELLALLDSSRSPKLRIAILELFRLLAWEGAEERSLRLVEERDTEDPGLVAAALSYLAEIRSKKALAFAPKLVEEDDKRILPALVRLLGRAGGREEEKLLLEWLDADGKGDGFRQEAIRALGDIGSEAAADRLAAIVEDSVKPKAERMFAAESLGKIGRPASVPSLVKAANGEDPNVRAKALEALGSFEVPEAEAAIVEGLRDSFVQSRIAACKAAGRRGLKGAVDFLAYKAEFDPDRAVRAEALRALAEIGGARAFEAVTLRMNDTKADAAARVLAFGLLARKNPPGAMAGLETFLRAAGEAKERSLYTALAREIASAGDAKEAAPLARILMADRDFLIRIGGIEWANKSKAAAARKDLEALAASDPAEAVRKRAAEVLKSFP